MKTFYSTIEILAMMIAVLSFTDCSGDEDGGDSTIEQKNHIGTWTTVAVKNAPSSQMEEKLFAYFFDVYWDDGYQYDGNEAYLMTPELLTVEEKSFDGKHLIFRIPQYENLEIIMKKYGTLNDDDYKNKLCHGFWVHYKYDSDYKYGSELGSYSTLAYYENKTLQQIASSEYGKDFQLVRFRDNGSGECFWGSSKYDFTWHLSNKTLFVKKKQ